MKWIKASEKLPEGNLTLYGKGSVFVRNTQTKHGGMIFIMDLIPFNKLKSPDWLTTKELYQIFKSQV
jgi:hypothetical protein